MNGSYGSLPAGQDVALRWSHPMQTAVQVECKQVVKSVITHLLLRTTSYGQAEAPFPVIQA